MIAHSLVPAPATGMPFLQVWLYVPWPELHLAAPLHGRPIAVETAKHMARG